MPVPTLSKFTVLRCAQLEARRSIQAPMLENPELLRKMVHDTGAHSTDLQSPETVDHLCDKCVSYAQCWKPEADRLWDASQADK